MSKTLASSRSAGESGPDRIVEHGTDIALGAFERVEAAQGRDRAFVSGADRQYRVAFGGGELTHVVQPLRQVRAGRVIERRVTQPVAYL